MRWSTESGALTFRVRVAVGVKVRVNLEEGAVELAMEPVVVQQ